MVYKIAKHDLTTLDERKPIVHVRLYLNKINAKVAQQFSWSEGMPIKR
jgi:hypothetical protein